MIVFIAFAFAVTFEAQTVKQYTKHELKENRGTRSHSYSKDRNLNLQIHREKRIDKEIVQLKKQLADLQEQQISLRKNISERIDREITELNQSKDKELKEASEKRERKISDLKKQKELLKKEWK